MESIDCGGYVLEYRGPTPIGETWGHEGQDGYLFSFFLRDDGYGQAAITWFPGDPYPPETLAESMVSSVGEFGGREAAGKLFDHYRHLW